MNLYTIDYLRSHNNINEVEAELKEGTNSNHFRRVDYRKHGDYTNQIEQLDFYLKLNEDLERYKEYEYKALDFFIGPAIVTNDKMPRWISLDFYVVSPKMKELLEQLILPKKHRFYPILLDIDGKQSKKDYYLFQIEFDKFDYINFKESIFYGSRFIENKETGEEEEQITVYKKGELQTRKALGFMKEELEIYTYLKTFGVNQYLDILYLRPYYLINEKAFKLFSENAITGLEITPFYEKKIIFGGINDFGYTSIFAGYEVVMNGASSMDGIDISDFEK